MALPVAKNSTCDIYRVGNTPPADPDVAGVASRLLPRFVGGQEAGERAVASIIWTHEMWVESSVDIRDGYSGNSAFTDEDNVYIPDKNGTKFKVVFVEIINRGEATEYKRVFLDRHLPTWPANANAL